MGRLALLAVSLLLAPLALCADSNMRWRSKYFAANLQLPADRGLTYDGWLQQARQNLTLWRSNLFQRTMTVTKHIHRARVKAEQQEQQPSRRMQGSSTSSTSSTSSSNKPENPEHPRSQAFFQLSSPFITCPPPGIVSKVGGKMAKSKLGDYAEDGQKYLCNLGELKGGCTVLSIGSRADTTFEAAILDNTPCTVVTLDCTLKSPLQTLGDRHKFYPLCLGSQQQSETNPAFVTLPQLMGKLGKQRVDVLKMDIEGWEWDVLASMGTEPGYEASLPTQMAIEFHVSAGSIYRNSPSHMNPDEWRNVLWPLHSPTFSQFQLLMLHLVDLGYGITSRDDNPFASSCTELVFHRVPM